MADHPLRPATDRRLGRPLPHQLPNRTQAAPKAHYCFVPQDICGISPSFPGLSPTSGHIPTRYSPVRRCRCRPRDLHVLSMPPAFTLSQDQTLRFIHHHQAQNPAAAPNHPALTLSPTISQPSRNNQTPNQSTPKAPAPPLKGTNTRAPTAHPTPQHQAPTLRNPEPTRQSPQPSLSPAPSHPSGQPRTKHFQNRFICQRSTPDQPETTSGRPPLRQSSKTTAHTAGQRT